MNAERAATRVLVTGASSFSARHLIADLLDRGFRVATTARSPAGPPGLLCVPIDLRDRSAVGRLIELSRPDLVFHLAGSRHEAHCWASNVETTRHLLESCAARPIPPRLVFVSSAAVYGRVAPHDLPIREDAPLRPMNDYGASKAAAETLALSMHRRGFLPVVIARPFNLVGPGLGAGSAPADFARQALAARGGCPQPEIRVGLLSPKRDFVDVRDAVRAYRLLAMTEACWGRAYNVASGRAVSVGSLLEMILEAAGVSAKVICDARREGQAEIVDSVGDPTDLENSTGWTASTPLTRSIKDMLAAGEPGPAGRGMRPPHLS